MSSQQHNSLSSILAQNDLNEIKPLTSTIQQITSPSASSIQNRSIISKKQNKYLDDLDAAKMFQLIKELAHDWKDIGKTYIDYGLI
jgi:hypothetical protein